MSEPHSSSKGLLIQKLSLPKLLGVFAVLLVGWIAADLRSGFAVAPPQGVTHITVFAQQMKPPRRLARTQFESAEVIVWEGQLKPFPSVPSGPACYVFDRRGNLLEWSSETGEGGRVSEILAASRFAHDTSLSEVITSLTVTD